MKIWITKTYGAFAIRVTEKRGNMIYFYLWNDFVSYIQSKFWNWWYS